MNIVMLLGTFMKILPDIPVIQPAERETMTDYIKFFLVVILFSANITLAQEEEIKCQVKYISAENVYLDKGGAAGISIGDRLHIQRNWKQIGIVEVLFVAQYSSSSKIILQHEELKVGDTAVLAGKKESLKNEKIEKKTRKRIIPTRPDKSVNQHFAKISGSLTFQWYHVEDLMSSGLNFDQPTARLNFKARKLWGKDYNLRIKFRSRYNQRARRFSSQAPQNEWRNRIYMLSFSYDDESSLFNYKVGRIISNKFAGVGYIDGLSVQYNTTSYFRIGLFAGTQPEWQYSDFQTSLQKYGVYFNYLNGNYGTKRFESTLAFAGEYHGSIISREFIYLQNNVSDGSRLNIYQSINLDINRDWRKELTGETVSLSNLYFYVRYKFTKWFTGGINYDNRKNYYTYETRTIAEELFDDAFRHGLRSEVYFKFAGDIRINTQFGLRKRESDSEYTYSYRAGFSKRNFFINRLSIRTQFSGFSNYFTSGFSPSIRFSRIFFRGNQLGVSYGNYIYSLKSDNEKRMNQWIRANTYIDLIYRFFISGNYEYNWGDDSENHRISAELGYRF